MRGPLTVLFLVAAIAAARAAGPAPRTIATAPPGGFITVRQADGTMKRIAITGDRAGVPGAPGTGGFVRVRRADGSYAQVPVAQQKRVDPRAAAATKLQALVQAGVDEVLTAHAMPATSANRAMVVDAAERAGRQAGVSLLELLDGARQPQPGATVEETMRRCGALARVKKNRASRR